jgi:hypothetical protein
VELLREVDGGSGSEYSDAGSDAGSGTGEGPAGDLPDPIETTEFEIRHLQAAFGPLLPALLKQVGLTELKTRQHIDRIAAALRGTLVAWGTDPAQPLDKPGILSRRRVRAPMRLDSPTEL